MYIPGEPRYVYYVSFFSFLFHDNANNAMSSQDKPLTNHTGRRVARINCDSSSLLSNEKGRLGATFTTKGSSKTCKRAKIAENVSKFSHFQYMIFIES